MSTGNKVRHSILLRNGSRVVTDCYVTEISGTDEVIYEPVDNLTYREDTRLEDQERVYLIPGEGVSASELFGGKAR